MKLLACLLGLWVAGAAHAALRFDTREKTLAPLSSETGATATYSFLNAGDRPVRIRAVEVDCPCLRARWPERAVAAGEAASLAIVLDLANQLGTGTHAVRVLTDDPQNPSHILTLKLAIQDAVQFSPRFVYWPPEAALTPQIVTLTLHPAAPLTWEKWETSNPSFTVTELPADPASPQTRRLQITPPAAPRERAAGPIVLHFLRPDGSRYTTTLVARVL